MCVSLMLMNKYNNMYIGEVCKYIYICVYGFVPLCGPCFKMVYWFLCHQGLYYDIQPHLHYKCYVLYVRSVFSPYATTEIPF